MIKPLRKRHLQAWSLLALLLPAGIIAVVLTRPGYATNQLIQPERETVLPVLIKEVKKQDYCIRLRGNTPNSPRQLEWINTAVLRYPTAVIYKTEPGNHSISRGRLIGRIEARGSYHFMLPPDSMESYHFILYDFVKEELIDSVDFSVSSKKPQP